MALTQRVDRVSTMIEELMDREERYEIFLNASPWGIIVVDQTFHLVFVNKTFERMSGYAAHELVGEHLHVLIPKEDRKVHVKHEKAFVKNPYVRVGNHGFKPKVLTKSGNLVPVEISISPTRIHGKAFYFASIRELETLFNTVGHIEKEA